MSDNVESFLKQFCKSVDAPFEKHCRYCGLNHQAQSYQIVESKPDDDDTVTYDDSGEITATEHEVWFSIEYGRCHAMEGNQCLRTMAPTSKTGRDDIKALAIALAGE